MIEKLKPLALVGQIGIDIVSSIVISYLIGYGLDKLFRTNGVFSILFIIIGVAAGFYNFYRSVKYYFKKKDNKEKDNKEKNNDEKW